MPLAALTLNYFKNHMVYIYKGDTETPHKLTVKPLFWRLSAPLIDTDFNFDGYQRPHKTMLWWLPYAMAFNKQYADANFDAAPPWHQHQGPEDQAKHQRQANLNGKVPAAS